MADYHAGTSTTELATRYGIGKGTVLKVLREAGVELRWPRMTEPEIREATRLYESGLSLADVGKRLGRGYSTVHKALRRHGVKMRDPHGRL